MSVSPVNLQGRDARSTTLMLIIIILVYLSTEIPFMVITVLHVLSTRYPILMRSFLVAFFVSFVPLLNYNVASNICLVINAFICLFFPLNFAIYCGMSQDFRTTFKKMFIEKFKENSPDEMTNFKRYK